MKKLTLLLLSFIVVLMFQNCSNAGFNSADQASQSGGPGGVGGGDSILSILRAQTDTSSNQIVEISVDTQGLDGLVSILWDHVFKDDLLFCQQTSNFEARTVTFLCPDKGVLKVSVTLTLASGETYTDSIDVNLTGEVIGPGPGGPELTGAQLYTTYCIGCHGGIATSTKRGMTLARLNTGLNSVSQMTSLRTQFTEAQKQLMVDALK